MARIRHIAITAEDPFATAELFKKGFGLEEIGRGDSELAREVYLTDGYINVAIVCWKRTDRKSTRLNSSHLVISYAVFCLKKKKKYQGFASRRVFAGYTRPLSTR